MTSTSNDQTQPGLPGLTEIESKQEVINNDAPLAHRLRPLDFESFEGSEKLLKKYYFLNKENFPSVIIWGPPGSGKTTIAQILASKSSKEIYFFNAVLGGVNDLKKIISKALEEKSLTGKSFVIFIDEIHRFNKSQQDALLPFLEKGDFTLLGATTENPRTAVNKALLSRLQVIQLEPLNFENLKSIIQRALKQLDQASLINEEVIDFICDHSGGDSRKALNFLEQVLENPDQDLKTHQSLIIENSRSYDRNKDRHYDVISAFIKSMRGSDPDAALLWLAVMLDGGEDPFFIARRMVIFASEDIGNADPQALSVATATLQAVQLVGMPEAGISLAQGVTYLSSTHKSNASYKAYKEAISYVGSRSTIEVPEHLKNMKVRGSKPYLYPHDYDNHYVKQDYTNEKNLDFYRPTNLGFEQNFTKRFERLKIKSDQN